MRFCGTGAVTVYWLPSDKRKARRAVRSRFGKTATDPSSRRGRVVSFGLPVVRLPISSFAID